MHRYLMDYTIKYSICFLVAFFPAFYRNNAHFKTGKCSKIHFHFHFGQATFGLFSLENNRYKFAICFIHHVNNAMRFVGNSKHIDQFRGKLREWNLQTGTIHSKYSSTIEAIVRVSVRIEF